METEREQFNRWTIERHTFRQNFKRSKNRSKPWTFRCGGCDKLYTDEELPHYWIRENHMPYCSRECAISVPVAHELFDAVLADREDLIARAEQSFTMRGTFESFPVEITWIDGYVYGTPNLVRRIEATAVLYAERVFDQVPPSCVKFGVNPLRNPRAIYLIIWWLLDDVTEQEGDVPYIDEEGE